MQGAYLGPDFTNAHNNALSKKYDTLSSHHITDEDKRLSQTVKHIADGKVVGWFQGRMEFGPRALGNRSILGDPRNPDMQRIINQKIKFRESFRPFAPSVLEEEAASYFDLDEPSPYMILVRPLQDERLKSVPELHKASLMDQLGQIRSDNPSITHVDNTTLLQTVSK